jgi:hypothetical protein
MAAAKYYSPNEKLKHCERASGEQCKSHWDFASNATRRGAPDKVGHLEPCDPKSARRQHIQLGIGQDQAVGQ